MGTTFANLQIHNLSIEEAENLVPGSMIKQFNHKWITITSEKFVVGNVEQIARKLSKQIESVVLSVEVYDDDILILNVLSHLMNIFIYTIVITIPINQNC